MAETQAPQAPAEVGKYYNGAPAKALTFVGTIAWWAEELEQDSKLPYQLVEKLLKLIEMPFFTRLHPQQP